MVRRHNHRSWNNHRLRPLKNLSEAGKRRILLSWDEVLQRAEIGRLRARVGRMLAWGLQPMWRVREGMLAVLFDFPSWPQGSWYWFGLWLILVVAVLAMLPLLIPMWWKEMLLGVVLLRHLERVVNFWRARIDRRDGRLVKWGPNEWVLESGAWNHHTSNLELLLEGGDFQLFQEMDASSSGDDVQGRGSVRTDCFEFPGVHCIVGDDMNVVSVSQLARDHGLVTVFEPTSCHVKNKKTGKIVGKGRLRNGMYILDSLRIVGQYIGDGSGASRGDRRDGADGGGGGRGHEARGNNGDGESTSESHGGGGRYGRGGGAETGARNQEEGSSGDVNEIYEEENSDEIENQEMSENEEDEIKEIGEINDKWEKGEDEKRGGQNFGQLSSRSHTGLFGMSGLDCIWWIVSILCIGCILISYTGWGARLTILAVNFNRLVAAFCVLFIWRFQLMSKTSKEEETLGPYLQEFSHQEQNKRLFGLSRFDTTTDPTGQLPARAFASSTNAAHPGRPEHFFFDSGAPYHITWKQSILFPYPTHLQNHTKPPTWSLGGIAVGSIAVTRSGYLNGNKIMLDGVLLAPDAQANLVSPGQLTNQYDVIVEMDAEGFVIKKRDGVQVGEGRMLDDGHHYVLQYFRPGRMFAHLHTPHPKIFGKIRPGPAYW